eukprot:837226-Pelagomonas_calceolata.AAC.2
MRHVAKEICLELTCQIPTVLRPYHTESQVNLSPLSSGANALPLPPRISQDRRSPAGVQLDKRTSYFRRSISKDCELPPLNTGRATTRVSSDMKSKWGVQHGFFGVWEEHGQGPSKLPLLNAGRTSTHVGSELTNKWRVRDEFYAFENEREQGLQAASAACSVHRNLCEFKV